MKSGILVAGIVLLLSGQGWAQTAEVKYYTKCNQYASSILWDQCFGMQLPSPSFPDKKRYFASIGFTASQAGIDYPTWYKNGILATDFQVYTISPTGAHVPVPFDIVIDGGYPIVPEGFGMAAAVVIGPSTTQPPVDTCTQELQMTLSKAPIVPMQSRYWLNGMVDPANGESKLDKSLYTYRSGGVNLRVAVRYRSGYSATMGLFGYGNRSDFDQTLIKGADGNVTLFDKNGETLYFKLVNGAYVPIRRGHALKVNADGTWQYMDAFGITSIYNAQGRLMRECHWNGNCMRVTYNPTDIWVDNHEGKRVTLKLTTSLNRTNVTSIIMPDGKVTKLAYLFGDLKTITPPDLIPIKFSYSSHKMTSYTDREGKSHQLTYDARKRVTKIYGSGERTKSIKYNTANVAITDGTTVIVQEYTKCGTLAKESSANQVVIKEWDDQLNLRTYSDKQWDRVISTYDSNNNVIERRISPNQFVQYAYSTNYNQLIEIRMGGLKSNITYDSRGDVLAVIGSAVAFDTQGYVGGIVVNINKLGLSDAIPQQSYRGDPVIKDLVYGGKFQEALNYGRLQGITNTEQQVIEFVADKYMIDMINMKGNIAFFDNTLNDKIAKTNGTDAVVRIGPGAFTSEEQLAATLGHESIHANDIATRSIRFNETFTEINATTWQIDKMKDDFDPLNSATLLDVPPEVGFPEVGAREGWLTRDIDCNRNPECGWRWQ